MQDTGKLDPEHGIAVFCDGSADNGGDRSGGWAWVAVDGFGTVESNSGWATDTTNNKMELRAVERALYELDEIYGRQDVLVFSDSQYVVLGCTDKNRKRNVNKEEWAELDKAHRYHCHVDFEHVKGHDGDKYNELADELAGKARKKGQKQ
jgi:ribonuclease HI